MSLRLRARAWIADYRYALWKQLESALTRRLEAPQNVDPARPPVVIVPGVYESWAFMRSLAHELEKRGHSVYFVESLSFHTMDIPSAAEAVRDVIARHSLKDVVIVAHSKGGLVGKYLLVHLDPERKVRRLIAVAAPFSGSFYALLWLLPSVRVLAPTNRIIRSLKKERAENARIVSVYGAFDPHIPGGSHLEGAVNVRVSAMGHFRILEDPEVVEAVCWWAGKGSDGSDGS